MFGHGGNTMGLELTTENNTTAHTCTICLPHTEGSIVLMALATGFFFWGGLHHWLSVWHTQEAWVHNSDDLSVCVRDRYLCNMGNSRKQCSSQWPAARIYWGINGNGQTEHTYDGGNMLATRNDDPPPKKKTKTKKKPDEAGRGVSGGSSARQRAQSGWVKEQKVAVW